MESILTPDEIAESELRVSIIGELILKVLAPLGKTLAVVPLEMEKEKV